MSATEAVCPICSAPQTDGIACSTCVLRLEQDLAEVPAIVAELDVSLSKQARIGASGPGGLARERMPLHAGAMAVATDLAGTLAAWASEVAPPRLWSSKTAAAALLTHMPDVRAHARVANLVDEITDAVAQARRIVDRPAERQFVGPCYADNDGITCTEDLYAKPGNQWVRCKVCGAEHEVAERRAWLLGQAADMLVTVREASRYVGEIGGIRVTESSIRGYLHRGRLAYRPHTTTIRLGDLLAVVLDDSERKAS